MQATSHTDSIPMYRSLLERPDLSRAAVLLYGVLASLDHGDGVTLTVRQISELSGLSPFERKKGGLRRYMKALEVAGLMRKHPGIPGGALRYEMLGPKPPHCQCNVRTPAVVESVQE